MVFTLVLWGRAEGRLGSLLRHLLDGPPRQSLLAGRILGECGGTRPAEASQVIDRLIEMALGDAGVVFRDDFGDDPLRRRGRRDPGLLAAEPGAAFWLLGSIHGDSRVAAVLRSIAASSELAIETRTDAAVALGRSSDGDGAIEILRSLAEDHISPATRVRIAEAIIVLDSDAAGAAEAVLRTITTGTGSHGAAVRAAELLAELGQPEQAVDLAWSVINENDSAYPAQTISAIRIILRYQGADGAAGLLHVAGGHSAKAGQCSGGSSSNSRDGVPAITLSGFAGKPSLILAPSNGNGRAWLAGGHLRRSLRRHRDLPRSGPAWNTV